MGSHTHFCERITEKYFVININRDKLLYCYDNSILYGFDFLSSVRKIIKKNMGLVIVFLFSDYGLVNTKQPPYLVHGSTGELFSSQAVEFLFMLTSKNNKEPIMIKRNYNLRDFTPFF